LAIFAFPWERRAGARRSQGAEDTFIHTFSLSEQLRIAKKARISQGKANILIFSHEILSVLGALGG
jgi:hypothetical protein